MSKDYLLGTSDTELERLGFQHQVWQLETASLWRRAGFRHGQALIDLGCGPGLATVELARLLSPAGSVLGVDASQRFLDVCQARVDAETLRNVTLLQADVSELELEANHYDGVFIRWLLCFLAQPEKALAHAYASLKPGGRVALIDYYNYLSVCVEPRHPAIQRIFTAYGESTDGSGYGFEVGGQLTRLLGEAGFEIESSESWVRSDRPGSNLWRWVELFHHSYGTGLVDKGLMSEAEMDAFKTAWEQVRNNPESVFSSPPMFAIVARKPL